MKRNKRFVFFFLLLQVFIVNVINAQTQIVVEENNNSVSIDTAQLLKSITALDKALLDKDSVSLAGLLNDEVEIEHSNGWIQAKENVFEDFRDSTLSYDEVENLKINNIQYRFNTADVQRTIEVKGRFKDYNFDMKLNVYEEWEYEKSQWQLWSRRSEKIK